MNNEPVAPAVDRRTFLQRGAALATGGAVAARFGLFGQPAAAHPGSRYNPHCRGGYGPLAPVADRATGLELLQLPSGFEYTSFGWTGDEMSDGRSTPGAHDGMGSFAGPDGLVRLVRNHEISETTGAFASGMTYDPAAGGGTTTLTFDVRRGELVDSRASLAGLIRPCAGGTTPWRTWLSCEETGVVVNGVQHGYVFEVPAVGAGTGEPLRGLGRFNHEAAAVDPATGIVYLTEDATPSGLYRFIPDNRGDLAGGGRLQMLKIGSATVQTYNDTAPRDYGTVSWVDIDDPDPAPSDPSVVAQGIARGGAQFERLEGIVHHRGILDIVSTSGGPSQGQVFEFDLATDRLRLVFHSPSVDVLDSPDNVCRSPRGGIVLCEDGAGDQLLQGLTPWGEIFPFAKNNVVLDGERGFTGDFRGAEWAGATFEPRRGRWLFANIYTPGITFAITGPWKRGCL